MYILEYAIYINIIYYNFLFTFYDLFIDFFIFIDLYQHF